MSISHEIIYGTYESVKRAVTNERNVNGLDKYGFTALAQAALKDDIRIVKLLLQHQADVNEGDYINRTPLYWAVDNENTEIAELLLKNKANPNCYPTTGEPLLATAMMRESKAIVKLLRKYGAKENFAKDYIHAKLIGHRFELNSTVRIVNAKGDFTEMEFEGFYLICNLTMIRQALEIFWQEKCKFKIYSYKKQLTQIIKALKIAYKLRKFKKRNIDHKQHLPEISKLLTQQELLILPVSYRGHAITFVIFGDYLAKCDRGVDSKVEETVVIYKINNKKQFNQAFLMYLLYEKHSETFIKSTIINLLQLTPIINIPTNSQIAGNCSWANVEASIPTALFMLLMHKQGIKASTERVRKIAMNFYYSWVDWNKAHYLTELIETYWRVDKGRKASFAMIIAAVFFQALDPAKETDFKLAKQILPILKRKPYDFVLKTYIEIFTRPETIRHNKNFNLLLKKLNVNLQEFLE